MYVIFVSKGIFQVLCGMEGVFFVPSIMCCEDITDRKATNYVGIVLVSEYVDCASRTHYFFILDVGAHSLLALLAPATQL